MAGATAGGQLIVLAALPFLTRLYVPEEFGAAAAFAAVVGLVVIVATFRYELAIPLPRRDKAAYHLVALSFSILSIVAPVAGVSWLLASRWISLDVGLPDSRFAILITVGIFATGAYQILSYWLVRRKKFGAIAITRIQQGLAGNGAQLAGGVAGLGTLGLIVGQILGQGAGITRLATEFRRDYKRSGCRLRISRLKWAARRYRQFPLFDIWAGLLSLLGAQAPILLFTALFSPALAGYYALAYRFLSAPMGLVGTAVSKPLLSRVVDARRDGDAAPLTARLLRALALVSLPPFAIMAVMAQEFVPIAFGAEWAPAAVVVTWTATWVGWQFICSPLSVILIAIEAQKLNSMLQFGLVALRISALLGGAAMGSAEGALAGFSIASIIGYAAYTAAVGKAVGLTFGEMVKAVCRPTVIAGLCLACLAIPPDMPVTRYVAIASIAAYWIVTCGASMWKRL